MKSIEQINKLIEELNAQYQLMDIHERYSNKHIFNEKMSLYSSALNLLKSCVDKQFLENQLEIINKRSHQIVSGYENWLRCQYDVQKPYMKSRKYYYDISGLDKIVEQRKLIDFLFK